MIRRLMQAALVAAGLLIAAPLQAQAPKSFVRDDLASQAIRLEQTLKTEGSSSVNGRSAQQLRRDGEVFLSRGLAQNALSSFTAAIAAEPGNAANWSAYARAALAVDPGDNWQERYKLKERRATAAYAAYQKALNPADEAAALALLGQVYATQEAWRRSLNAYAASLKIRDDRQVRATYEALREEHGFRITDFKVDSDAATPRVCFIFSDPLAPKVDFTPYLAVSGAANAAVSAEGNQLCVDGLKHGERYAFVLRQGLPSSVGENLLKSADYEVYVRDRSPQARFTGRNYVLPSTGQEGIPIVSVNTTKVDVEVYRIGDRSLAPTVRSYDFLGQLGRYSAAEIGREKGLKVWNGTLDTASTLNQDVVTAFPVTEAVGKMEPGVYVMTAKPHDGTSISNEDGDDYGTLATQWFVVSDLGLTAFTGRTGVQVFVRSLARADPVADVEVRLVARNNEVLATKTTDKTGMVSFDPGLARGEGGMAPGLAVATIGSDYGFLNLESAAFDLSDRGVKGRVVEGAVDAFLYTERGVYRTGETVQLTALLRDAHGVALPNLPLTLVVRRPDGVEYRRALVEDQGLGGRAFSIPILPGSLRGTWRIAAYTDPKGPPVGQTAFLVEDYVPERLEVNLTPKTETLRPGEPAEIDVSARYLYGAPGSGLDVSGEVAVAEAKGSGIKGLEGFTVGLQDESVEASTAEIEETATTDPQGRVTMQVPVQDAAASRPTEARITLRVAEPGGRAVERSVTLPILPKGPVVAVHKLFGNDLAEGANATFDVVLAAPDGRRLAGRDVSWTLSRIDRRYQWYNSGGSWNYEPVKSTRRVADGTLAIASDAPARITAPVRWGTYRLDVSAPALGETAQTSVSFTVGWSGDQTAETPDLLEMNLDRASYRAGDTMRVRLNPRFAGKATLAVVSDKVHDIRIVDIAAAGTEVSIPVRAEWGPGAYLVGMAHRPLDQAAKRMPGRALGTAWFEINRDERSLQVNLNAPEKIRPRGTLNLPIKVTGLNPGEEARITVAAVDVGILNLTRYEAPKPFDYFFGQKSLSADIRDLYGYLIDGMQGTRGAIRSGGDTGTPALNDIPPTQEPFARYSGVVRVDADGSANITFEVPAFNGTARVMAVAWTKERVGNASADVIIRDPVVLTGTMPRFLSIGDQSRFFVQLDNVEGPAGEYTVDLDLRGPIVVAADALRSTLRLDAKAKGSVAIPVTAAGMGTATIDVILRGPNIEEATQRFTVAVQPGTSALNRRTIRSLDPGASVTLSKDLVSDILGGTGAVSVSVSPMASLDVPGLLKSLDRYPYGCTEQTVSRALPLLYVNRLAEEENLSLDEKVDERIRSAIERILARQDSNGSFGLWGIGGDDIWLDAYTTDFLTRARERGFAVPQTAFNIALDRLRNFVANTTEVEENAVKIAYAAYVLARNGRPVMGDLRYLADTKMNAFASPLARGQLAAALALLGDRGRAQSAFASAVQSLQSAKDTGDYREDYGSRLRDGAAILALASETDNVGNVIRPVSMVLDQERGNRRTSTQEEAWLVLAAQAIAHDAEAMRMTVNGMAHKGAFYGTYRDATLAQDFVTLANAGQAPVQAVITVTGNPIEPEPAISHGYGVERSYYRLDGTPVQPDQVRQNDRLVAVLKVTETEAKQARVLLIDRLPAGFEIDNPKLVDSDTVAGLDWLTKDVEPAHTEYRDDRLVVAFDRNASQPATFTVAYTLRAVSPGRYVHPPAQIEDMYRPERYGRTGYGSVEVTAARP